MDTKHRARVAGWLYLALAATGPFSLIYVPTKLIVPGDAAATTGNIAAHELLFRAGVLGTLTTAVLFAFVALALYRLLEGVGRPPAVAMAVLALLSVPIAFTNVLNQMAVLSLLGGAGYLSALAANELQALAMLFVKLNGYGNTVQGVLWGLWLLPFGLLVYRSVFLPRVLGVLLVANGIAYVAESVTTLLLPGYAALVSRVAMPFLVGEIVIALWLVTRGARVLQPSAALEHT